MKKNFLSKLTPAEFEIMYALWNAEEMTVTEIMNKVNNTKNRNLSRSTLQVQVGRLE